jgi:lia operon protein LiaF
VAEEEVWTFVGDVYLDLTQADVPIGETRISALGFIGDIDLKVPQNIGISLLSNSFVSEVKFLGKKHSSFLTSANFASENYETAERKVQLEATFFVGDVNVKHIPEQET